MIDAPFPDFDAEKELKRIIAICSKEPRDRRNGRPRWMLVMDITGHGSAYSIALCEWAGFAPHERVVKS